MSRRAGIALIVLVACDADPERVGWRIEFDPAVAASGVARVRAYVALGGCDGPRLFEADVGQGETAPEPGALEDGRYGFGADAVDTACRRIASDCVAVDWPADANPVVVRLTPTAPEAECAVAQCVGGACERSEDLACGTPGPCSGPVVEVSTGRSHTCARTAAGEVWCWGRSADGQLGRPDTPVVPGPVALPAPATSISAGGPDAIPSGHTCAVLTTDEVWCWGANDAGQTTVAREDVVMPSPVRVDVPAASDVQAGGRHTCALTADGGVWCWGDGEQFQLGDGVAATRAGPTSVALSSPIDQLGLGNAHACVMTDRDRLICWGRAADGQLGNVTARTTPDLVEVNNGRDLRILAVGSNHVCFVRNGPPASFACFGRNAELQLGLPDPGRVSRPTMPDSVAVPETIDQMGLGSRHSCLLRTDGKVYCHGDNADGQLGRPDIVQTSTPAEVLGLSDVVDIDAGFAHTCAVRANGEVWCWGRNRFGQLGDGSTEARFSPTRALALGVE